MRLREAILSQPSASRQAVIDIGSNTVRLVIYGGPARAPVVLLNEKVTARLGKAVAETGLLSERAMTAALTALHRYAALLQAQGIRRVQTVATAAVRDAANGSEFLARVTALGLSPRLLSGEEEALGAAMGVSGAFPTAKGVVADLGGGSLELVHIDGMRAEHGHSLPLGTLRLAALRSAGPAKFRRQVEKLVRSEDIVCAPGEALYLVGGSFRALAAHIIRSIDSPIDDPHGLTVDAAQIRVVCTQLLRAKKIPSILGVSAGRMASLPDVAALLSAVLEATRAGTVVFSGWGLREGLVFAGLDATQQAGDPLLAGVMAFADPGGAPAAVATMVAGWTASVAETPDAARENLRLAATILALAAHQLEPNLRGVTVLDWALHKRWIGLDFGGRAMLAACLLASTNRAIPAEISGLASAEQLHEAVTWGLAIRLCRRLTALAPQLFSACTLQIDSSRLILRLDQQAAPLATDIVEKDFRILAAHLGLEPVIESPEMKSPAG